MQRLPIMLAAAALACLPDLAQAQAAGRADRGQALARAQCARCHAIGPAGDSRIPEAPPFRDLHRRYPVEQLAEALAEGLTTGHGPMPEFRFEPAEINDLIAYLKTLER